MGWRRAAVTAATAALACPALLVAGSMLRTHVVGQRPRGQADVEGDVGVIFGAQVIGNEPGPVLRSRLDHAVDLYRAGRLRRLGMAGGVPVTSEGPAGGDDEVPAMVTYALRAGVRQESIVEIRPGQNTREQVSSTRRVVVDERGGRVVAVSSSYHLARIRDEARRRGFDVAVTAPRASPDTASLRLYLAHLLTDALAGIWYALPPRVAERVDTSAGSFRHLGLLAMTGDIPWRDALRARPTASSR